MTQPTTRLAACLAVLDDLEAYERATCGAGRRNHLVRALADDIRNRGVLNTHGLNPVAEAYACALDALVFLKEAKLNGQPVSLSYTSVRSLCLELRNLLDRQ